MPQLFQTRAKGPLPYCQDNALKCGNLENDDNLKIAEHASTSVNLYTKIIQLLRYHSTCLDQQIVDVEKNEGTTFIPITPASPCTINNVTSCSVNINLRHLDVTQSKQTAATMLPATKTQSHKAHNKCHGHAQSPLLMFYRYHRKKRGTGTTFVSDQWTTNAVRIKHKGLYQGKYQFSSYPTLTVWQSRVQPKVRKRQNVRAFKWKKNNKSNRRVWLKRNYFGSMGSTWRFFLPKHLFLARITIVKAQTDSDSEGVYSSVKFTQRSLLLARVLWSCDL